MVMPACFPPNLESGLSSDSPRQSLDSAMREMHDMRLSATQAGGDVLSATTSTMDSLQETATQLAGQTEPGSSVGDHVRSQIAELQSQIDALQERLNQIKAGGSQGAMARFENEASQLQQANDVMSNINRAQHDAQQSIIGNIRS